MTFIISMKQPNHRQIRSALAVVLWHNSLGFASTPQRCHCQGEKVSMPGPHVGDAAPDFTLPRSLDATLTLSQCLAHGPVLLHFYVFDFGTV